MADATDSKKPRVELPWATVVTATIAVCGFALYLSPIRTARPTERTGFHSEIYQRQDAEARLWQDALRAATEHETDQQWKCKEAKASGQPCSDDQHHSERSLSDDLHNEKCWILAVMIPGSAYAEFSEARLRIRQSVLEGLGKNKYVPADGEHIGYIKINQRDYDWHDMIIPYEWCHYDRLFEGESPSLPDHVCVLWLRDEQFRDRPLTRLDGLFRDHLGAYNSNTDRLEIRVIGPYSSTTLNNMVKEASENSVGPELLQGVDMWSSNATVDDALLLKNDPESESPSKVEDVFAKCSRLHSFTFKRSTRTDGQIMRKVMHELQVNRGLEIFRDGREGKDCVALISEWDTLFGRALPWSTKRAIIMTETKSRRKPLFKSLPNTARQKYGNDESAVPNLGSRADKLEQEHVMEFSYLRGVDGQLPGAIAINETWEKNNSANPPAARESTEGLNQSDYLRRLSKELIAADARLRKKNASIKAVGVLGGDVYDKLLVLQALRRSLPNATFFTNNYDARLAHADEWPWTRNLLIVSPFGPRLKSEYQNVPPFRDSNQTAMYAASLLISKGTRAKDFNIHSLGPVRLYEVGRRGAYDLTATPKARAKEAEVLQPPSADIERWLNLSRGEIIIFIFALLLVGLLWISFVVLRSGSFKRIFSSSWAMFLLLTIVAVTTIWFVHWSIGKARQNAEPYSWTDGISVWPTDTLRLLACLLSIFYVIKTSRALSKNARDLQGQFGLIAYRNQKSSYAVHEGQKCNFVTRTRRWLRSVRISGRRKTLPLRFANWLRSLSVNWDVSEKRDGSVNSQILWQLYVRSNREAARIVRILPLVFCYFFAGSLLFDLFGPPRDLARGPALHWDFWLGRCSAFALIILTFYVADATLLNRRLIAHLTGRPTRWPQEAFSNLRTKWGLEDPRVPQNRYLVDYLDIEFVALRTEVVGGLIYYPFVITSVLILSRATIFDYWTWTPPLLLMIGFTTAIAAFSAFYLRRTAEAARKGALQNLHDNLVACEAQDKVENKDVNIIREATGLISAESRGAFAAISQHPLAGALLLPSGSAGLWALLQYFPRLLGS
jgi:hypothetical protein